MRNKKYKALVVDFDGVLLEANCQLSSKVEKAVVNLMKKGYAFSIASERPYQGIVKAVCNKLQLKNPQIVSGGAKIIDPKTENLLWAEYIPYQVARKIIAFLLRNEYEFFVESEGFVYTSAAEALEEYGPGIIFKNLNQVDYQKIAKIVLVVLVTSSPNVLGKKIEDNYPDLHIIRSGVHRVVLDITSKKATKYLAVLKLAEILHIDPTEMIGVGDGYNDYPLLSACGYKVARENTPNELKEIADLIVPSVENDGLVVLIEKFI